MTLSRLLHPTRKLCALASFAKWHIHYLRESSHPRNRRQSPLRPAHRTLIRNEIHRPCLIRPVWHCQRLRLVALQRLLGFDPQIELQFAADPVDLFVVPAVALGIVRLQKAEPKAQDQPDLITPAQAGFHIDQANGGDQWARNLAHAPAQFCDPSAGSGQ